jgi:hypothetical protein
MRRLWSCSLNAAAGAGNHEPVGAAAVSRSAGAEKDLITASTWPPAEFPGALGWAKLGEVPYPGKTEGNRSKERPRLDRGAALWRNAYLFRHVGSRCSASQLRCTRQVSRAARRREQRVSAACRLSVSMRMRVQIAAAVVFRVVRTIVGWYSPRIASCFFCNAR